MTLQKIYNLIQKRKKEMPKGSYVADLFRAGNDRIIQKVGEEATEVVIAAKNAKKKEIISEMADLWFNSLILLSFFNLTLKDVEKELEYRRKRYAKKRKSINDKIRIYD